MFDQAVEQCITILFKVYQKVQFLLTDKTAVLILKLLFFSKAWLITTTTLPKKIATSLLKYAPQ